MEDKVTYGVIGALIVAVANLLLQLMKGKQSLGEKQLDDRGRINQELLTRLEREVTRLDNLDVKYDKLLRMNSYIFAEMVFVRALTGAILSLIQMPDMHMDQIRLRLEEVIHRIDTVEIMLQQEYAKLDAPFWGKELEDARSQMQKDSQ
jgi:hypothetical protein